MDSRFQKSWIMDTQNVMDRWLELDVPSWKCGVGLHKLAMKKNSFLNMFLMVPVVTDVSLKERNFRYIIYHFLIFWQCWSCSRGRMHTRAGNINSSKNCIPDKKMIMLKNISVKRKRSAEINYYLLRGFSILNMIYLFWHFHRNIEFIYY